MLDPIILMDESLLIQAYAYLNDGRHSGCRCCRGRGCRGCRRCLRCQIWKEARIEQGAPAGEFSEW